VAEVRVKGLKELNRALKRTDKEVRLGIRKELREVAEPVRSQAETLAGSEIRNLKGSWTRMRVGITLDTVYVAPRERGIKSRGLSKRKRPNLAPLMMNRALQPALDRNADWIEQRFTNMLDGVCNDFSKG